MDLKYSIRALEGYANEHYSNTINAFIYGEERTNLINEVRIVTEKATTLAEALPENTNKETHYKELWNIRDDPKGKKWIFS